MRWIFKPHQPFRGAKTRRPLICLFLSCAAVLLAADAAKKTVSIHQVPPAVKKAIEDELGSDKLVEIEKDDSGGEVSYSVTRSTKDGDRYFVVSEDSTLSSVEVSLEDTPAPVQKTIKAQVGQGTLDDIEKSFDGDEISYEVDMTDKDGKERSFSIALNGSLTSIQVTIEEVPGPVRKTIESHVGTGKLGDVYRLIDGAEISYDAEVEQDGKTRDVVVSANGKLESVQAFLSEIPAEAQQTIKEKVGSGKIVRIDLSTTLRHGVQPYEVEARKDGKPFNFSVGPKGRFLGMD